MQALARALPANAAERLGWAGLPDAPMTIAAGPPKGQVLVDHMITEVLQRGLPLFHHEQLQVAPKRLDIELNRSEQALRSPVSSETPQRLER